MIALLGGTFDPVHVGHLAAAKAARALLSIESVHLVVAGDPYHKRPQAPISPALHRLAMVKLACANAEGLIADDSDLGHSGPSFTVNLLERRAHMDPAEQRVWIIGEDAFADILSWSRVKDVFALTSFLVFARHDQDVVWSTELSRFVESRRVPALTCKAHGQVLLADEKLPAVSSTMIRGCIRRRERVDEWLPPAVLKYIQEHHLYEETREAR